MNADHLPCPAALIAQAMGLMTSYAASGCTGARQAIAQAVIERLYLLGQHPQLPVPLQLSMRQAHGNWLALLQSLAEPASEELRPWVH